VFKTPAALALYWNDTISVGQPIGLQTYLDEGAAVLVPNGTLLIDPVALRAVDPGHRCPLRARADGLGLLEG
jgi:hypothetical protein